MIKLPKNEPTAPPEEALESGSIDVTNVSGDPDSLTAGGSAETTRVKLNGGAALYGVYWRRGNIPRSRIDV
jgi:hypothetical protein